MLPDVSVLFTSPVNDHDVIPDLRGKNINVLISNTYSVFYILVEKQLRHEVSLNDGKYRPVSLRSITANFFDLQLKRESNIVVIIMIAIEIILTEGRPPPLMLPVEKSLLKRFTQSR